MSLQFLILLNTTNLNTFIVIIKPIHLFQKIISEIYLTVLRSPSAFCQKTLIFRQRDVLKKVFVPRKTYFEVTEMCSSVDSTEGIMASLDAALQQRLNHD